VHTHVSRRTIIIGQARLRGSRQSGGCQRGGWRDSIPTAVYTTTTAGWLYKVVSGEPDWIYGVPTVMADERFCGLRLYTAAPPPYPRALN